MKVLFALFLSSFFVLFASNIVVIAEDNNYFERSNYEFIGDFIDIGSFSWANPPRFVLNNGSIRLFLTYWIDSVDYGDMPHGTHFEVFNNSPAGTRVQIRITRCGNGRLTNRTFWVAPQAIQHWATWVGGSSLSITIELD